MKTSRPANALRRFLELQTPALFSFWPPAFNLGNFLGRLALPSAVKRWSLTTLQNKLIKIGAKTVRRARYVRFQMAEVAVPRDLFRAILAKIQSLADAVPAPTG